VTGVVETLLVVNAGSSSIKFQLFDLVGGDRLELAIINKHPRPKGRGIRRGDGEQLSYGGETDVELAHASNVRRKRRGMRPEVIQGSRDRVRR
jgi:acetate kinase